LARRLAPKTESQSPSAAVEAVRGGPVRGRSTGEAGAQATLAAIGKRAQDWTALTNGVVGEDRALGPLERIVAKRLADAAGRKSPFRRRASDR
jgi:hypothetical protein